MEEKSLHNNLGYIDTPVNSGIKNAAAEFPSKTTINKTTKHPSFCIAGVEISSFDFDLGKGKFLSQGGSEKWLKIPWINWYTVLKQT